MGQYAGKAFKCNEEIDHEAMLVKNEVRFKRKKGQKLWEIISDSIGQERESFILLGNLFQPLYRLHLGEDEIRAAMEEDNNTHYADIIKKLTMLHLSQFR